MKHYLFSHGRTAYLLHEQREIFLEKPAEPRPPEGDKPKDKPKGGSESEEKKETEAEKAARLQKEAEEVTKTQTEALNMVNAELKKWNDAQRTADASHKDVAFKDLPTDARDDIRNSVMQTTGASVSEVGAVSLNKKSEIGMNKFIGTMGKFASAMGKFMEKLSPIFGKKTEKKDEKKEEKKEEKEKTPEDKAKGLQAMKESGLKFKAPGLDDPKATEYAVLAEPEKVQNFAPHFKFENGVWKMQYEEDVSKPWLDSVLYSTTGNSSPEVDATFVAWNKLANSIKTLNGAINKAKAAKKVEEETDKLKELVSSVKDNAWKRIENGGPFNYKRGSDDLVYRKDGNSIEVCVDNKWIDAAENAGINDPEIKKNYDIVLMQGGDQKWVRLSAVGWHFAIDLPNKRFISSDWAGNQQEYLLNPSPYWDYPKIPYQPGT